MSLCKAIEQASAVAKRFNLDAVEVEQRMVEVAKGNVFVGEVASCGQFAVRVASDENR